MGADDIRRSPEDEEFEDDPEQERGIGDTGDEFDEDEDEDVDGEEEDEGDLDSPQGMAEDRELTAEIGDEGGSQGDLEAARRKPRVMRGSEATTTAGTEEEQDFVDRHAGGGVGRKR